MSKNNNSLFIKKLKILNISKQIICKNGWNSKLFFHIHNKKKISNDQLNILFSENYNNLLNFSLEVLNQNLKKDCLKMDLIRLPLNKRVRKILLQKIKIMDREKKFYKKGFVHLLIPSKSKLLLYNLYKSVDLIWYIAGDTSTDFNYYTKRVILAGIYSRVILHFFNNNNIKDTENLLDESLKKVLLIPALKKNLKFFTNNIPNLWKFVRG